MSGIAKSGVVAMLAGVVLLASLAAVFAEQELQPSVFIPKMRHDFGKVYEQQTYEYTFKVSNRGKADLIIDNVRPG